MHVSPLSPRYYLFLLPPPHRLYRRPSVGVLTSGEEILVGVVESRGSSFSTWFWVGVSVGYGWVSLIPSGCSGRNIPLLSGG